MSRRIQVIQNIDWAIVLIYVALAFIGWMTIYSTGYNEGYASIFDFKMEYGKQFIWLSVSVILGLIILNIEGKTINFFSWVVYGFVIFLLLLVLAIGKEIHGNKAWIAIGSFSLQPAEFAKLATSLALAKYLSERGRDITNLRERVKAFVIFLIPVGLVMLQPDVGSALIASAFLFPLYREGMSGSILILGISSIVIGVLAILTSYKEIELPLIGEISMIWIFILILVLVAVGIWYAITNTVIPRKRGLYKRVIIASVFLSILFSLAISYVVQHKTILKKHHKDRIELLLGVASDKLEREKGYNMLMSKSAIGSGGFLGKGFKEGPMTHFNFVPEQGTDFIFTSLAEEWGFLGSSFIVILFVILILRLIYLAERQRSTFSRVFIYSVAGIIFMHFFINIGMVIGLAPVIGIPLPFFSYGGSSLLSFSIMLAIVIRLDLERFAKI